MAITFEAYARNNGAFRAARPMPSGSPAGIIIHSTGANNPNLRRYVNAPEVCGENPYKNFFDRADSDVCPHAVIGMDKSGEVRAAKLLPWNICCWGCGSSSIKPERVRGVIFAMFVFSFYYEFRLMESKKTLPSRALGRERDASWCHPISAPKGGPFGAPVTGSGPWMFPSPLVGLSSLCVPGRACSRWRASLLRRGQNYSCSVIAVFQLILAH